jgi:hypothetical protein
VPNEDRTARTAARRKAIAQAETGFLAAVFTKTFKPVTPSRDGLVRRSFSSRAVPEGGAFLPGKKVAPVVSCKIGHDQRGLNGLDSRQRLNIGVNVGYKQDLHGVLPVAEVAVESSLRIYEEPRVSQRFDEAVRS